MGLTYFTLSVYGQCMETTTAPTSSEVARLHDEWQHAERRGMPNRHALRKAYLAASAR